MMRFFAFFLVALLLFSGVSCQKENEGLMQAPQFTITTPPAGAGYDAWYRKYTEVNGIPVMSSWKVPDSCYVAAVRTLYAMTYRLDSEVLNALQEQGVRVTIMARYEGITDVPEYAWMRRDTTLTVNMDVRVRGVSGTPDCPVVTCAEENILGYQIDPYHAEDNLVHIFANTIQELGIRKVYPEICEALDNAFEKARAEGRWQQTFAIRDVQNYWAEGVQDWFNVNDESPWHDGEHCYVNTREELAAYDPDLHALIARFFPATAQQISLHAPRNLYVQEQPFRAPAEDRLDFEVPECVITPPPAELGLPTFYTKCCYANGIPICSSDRVPDSCLVQTHRTIYALTGFLPEEVLDAMLRVGTRISIIARYEGTTDIPEYADMLGDTAMNWNLRARGFGGTLWDPMSSGAEENILAYRIDKYHAEDILIHEFAHSIHLIGIRQTHREINSELKTLLDNALKTGKYKDTYAGTQFEEYWAEGVQDWFNVNAEAPHPDGKHNWVNTREDLKAYDPDLYALLARYFPETDAQISKHKKENLYTHE